jgi:hypothetical protein
VVRDQGTRNREQASFEIVSVQFECVLEGLENLEGAEFLFDVEPVVVIIVIIVYFVAIVVFFVAQPAPVSGRVGDYSVGVYEIGPFGGRFVFAGIIVLAVSQQLIEIKVAVAGFGVFTSLALHPGIADVDLGSELVAVFASSD